MLQKFDKDHRYKFSKEQIKKDYGEKNFESSMNNNIAFKDAIEYCEGKCVEVQNETIGWVNDETSKENKYQVVPEWCICVGKTN